jgi:hypothetical protein
MWMADDGKVFESQDECAEYEANELARKWAEEFVAQDNGEIDETGDYLPRTESNRAQAEALLLIQRWETWRRAKEKADKPKSQRTSAEPSAPLTEDDVLSLKRQKLARDVAVIGGSMAKEELAAFDAAYPHIAEGLA